MANCFREDPDLQLTYIANIAMLLHDQHGITNYKKRNVAAKDIFDLVFNIK
ncbi:MAG: hypothetical protein V3V68_05255 [Nitrosomonadaceae bacterium]